MSREPEEWAEQHSPTVLVENVISGSRRREAYRQREVDHRLLGGLTQDELRAFIEIDRAVHLAAVTRAVRAQVYERVDHSTGPDQESRYQNVILQTFSNWARLVLSDEKLDYRAIIAIISEGYGPSKVDRERRRGNGWARRNLGLGLGLWCELRGWA
jgi:hypothetical protein